MISKIEARNQAKEYRKSLTQEQKDNYNLLIFQRLLGLDEVKFAKKICVYLSFGNEVDTSNIIDKLWSLDKDIYAPITEGDNMYAVRITENTEYVLSRFGVKEPIGEKFNADKLDLVIVPLVAFNRQKDRVGYGKGFYDRFLPKGVLTVGIAYHGQEFDFVPQEFDKRLDKIVTDIEVIE